MTSADVHSEPADLNVEQPVQRGVAVLTAANVVYILCGYVLTVALAHLLGPATFGSYGVAIALISVVNIVITRGLPVAASRQIAALPGDHAPAVMRATARLMTPFSLATTAVVFLLSWPIAAILNDDGLRVALQISAVTAITQGIYTTLLAFANGTQLYMQQATSLIAYSIARLGAIVGGGYLAGLKGAVAGFVLAPLAGAIPVITKKAWLKTTITPPTGLIARSIPMLTTATFISLLLTIDLLAFKRVGTEHDVGIYTAAATIAHVPFFLLNSIPLVLLPAVAKASNSEQRRAVIVNAFGDAWIMLALPTALLIVLGDNVLPIIFSKSFTEASTVVAPLALATAAIVFHAIFVAVDAGIGRLRESVAIGLVGVVAMAIAVHEFGRGSNIGNAAWAAAGVAIVVAISHGTLIVRRVGNLFQLRFIFATAVAGVLSILTGFVPETFFAVTGAVAASCALYLLFVWQFKLLSRTSTSKAL